MKTTFISLAVLFLLCFINSSAQIKSLSNKKITDFDNTEPERIIKENNNSITVEYDFKGFLISEKEYEGKTYQIINIKGLGKTNIAGKPLTPSRTDLIAMPRNANPVIKVLDAQYVEYDNYLLCPGYKPLTDEKNDSLIFEIDDKFYQKDILFPAEPVTRENDMKLRELNIMRTKINPILYNPATKKIRVYTNIKYEIVYNSTDFSNVTRNNSNVFISNLRNLALNKNQINLKSKQRHSNTINYLIVTVPEYFQAAESLAEWKNQLGYKTKIIYKQVWTSQEVKDSVAYYYNNYSPHPDYVTFIGDHENVPAEMIDPSENFISDLYYVCMNGTGDFHPDMAKGRISADSPQEALDIVNKIVAYEKNPVQDPAFYANGMNCAYFQDDEPNTYATRRFVHTSEEVRDYLIGQGYNVNRVYYTDSSINPMYYNDGYYSDGQAIPSSLLRSNGFNWDGDYFDITTSINEGRFYVLHRDHGFTGGWGDPYFSTSEFNLLNNTDKYPVVFSINCSSGKFYYDQCFSEELLKFKNKGAVGVVGASNTSYSGYNDGLAIGFFDAIWSSPGLNPDFGSAGISNPANTPHSDIHRMGDVLNHGLTRMTETYGDLPYQYELFHYFGDPAMKIWTDYPDSITASCVDSLNCGDSSLNINGSTCTDGIATLCVNGILIGIDTLSGGSGTINFAPISNIVSHAVLTISKTNRKPYIKQIPIVNCANLPVADFISPYTTISICDPVIQFFDQSTYVPTEWKWTISPATHNFTNGTTDTTQNPFVSFDSPGLYTISLVVTNSNGSDSIGYQDYIDIIPATNLPFSDDLESYTSTTGMTANDWSFEVSGNSYEWKINNDSTPSYYTGPIVDHTTAGSSGIYIYTEASGGDPLDTASFITPCIDLSTVNIPVMTFWYHFHGSDIYKLNIDVKSGGSWVNSIYTLQGEQQTTYDDNWLEATVDLSAFQGETVNIRFRAIRGDYYQGDMAIDDINIGGNTNAPSVNFSSFEKYTCSGYNVSFTDSSCCGINNRYWEFPGGTPSTSTSANPVVTYSSPGIYDVKLKVVNPYGQDSLIKTSYINVGSNSNIPLSENFESFVSGSPGTFMNGWQADKTDGFEWRVNNGATASANTGPTVDHTLGNTAGKYIYTEASYVNQFEEAYLYSPCLQKDVGAQNTVLSFWYHMYGQYIDTLYVDLSNGSGWQTVFYLEGVQQPNQTDPWKQAFVNISSLAGQNFRLRFRSIRGYSYMEDVAVDDVNLDTTAIYNYSFNTDTLDFDSLQIINSDIRSFYFVNEGSMPINIDTVYSSPPYTISGNTSFYVAPGDSVEIFAEFAPTAIGMFINDCNIETQQGTIIYKFKGKAVNNTGINNAGTDKIYLYPNPAKDKLFFKASENYNLKISDINGKTIWKYNSVSFKILDCRHLDSGIYFVKIYNNENVIYKKVIIL